MDNLLRRRVILTPTITASAAYAAGNQLGPGSTQLVDVVKGPNHVTILKSIVVIDADNQKAAIDFLFFSSAPTVTGSDKAAFSISAAELKAKFVGAISLASGSYLSTAAQAVATVPGLDMLVQSKADTTNPFGKSLFMAMICRGTPTYTTTSSLVVDLCFQ